jgi:ribosomal protein L29
MMNREVCGVCGQSLDPNWIDERVPKLESKVKTLDAELTRLRAENAAQLAELHRISDALRDLANAADAVGVRYFDSDDLSDEVRTMLAATITARLVAAARKGEQK